MDGAQILIAGIGGLGGSWAQRAHSRTGHDIDLVLIDADETTFNAPDAHVIRLGRDLDSAGCAALPPLGEQRMRQASDVSRTLLDGVELVILLTGLGGGTGTGAAPVVAEIARQQGALAVGIVTEPFMMEGSPRMNNARSGIEELQEHVDTLITIKNQRLLTICGRETTLKDAFFKADEVLMQATRGIADLITIPGMINLDFNDVRTVISKGGDAIMGVGAHCGENRAVEAARKAINSPLLEDVSISGAKGVLINIAADSNLTLFEVNEAMSLIHEATGPDATIIFGTVIDDSLEGDIRVTVIATGFSHGRENTIPFRKPEQENSLQSQAVNADAPHHRDCARRTDRFARSRRHSCHG